MMGQISTTVVEQTRILAKAYYIAKCALLDLGYADEIDWQYSVSLDRVTDTEFLREAAWVVLSSGMSERVIRSKFTAISNAFYDWNDIPRIVRKQEECRRTALVHFNNHPKINAIVSIAEYLHSRGIQRVREDLRRDGIVYLQKLPYIGAVTSFHLAKNIGVPCAKPDRHLVRIADKMGYNCVGKLCEDIAELTEEPIAVVDLILWRYATIYRNYLERFTELLRIAKSENIPQFG